MGFTLNRIGLCRPGNVCKAAHALLKAALQAQRPRLLHSLQRLCHSRLHELGLHANSTLHPHCPTAILPMPSSCALQRVMYNLPPQLAQVFPQPTVRGALGMNSQDPAVECHMQAGYSRHGRMLFGGLSADFSLVVSVHKSLFYTLCKSRMQEQQKDSIPLHGQRGVALGACPWRGRPA